MVNVGLRAYIWQQKSAEHQTAREVNKHSTADLAKLSYFCGR